LLYAFLHFVCLSGSGGIRTFNLKMLGQVFDHCAAAKSQPSFFCRWSQKRRDRVDQILVRELHSEESAWTDYAEDEAEVKDQVSVIKLFPLRRLSSGKRKL
jgi:hypothetical protein